MPLEVTFTGATTSPPFQIYDVDLDALPKRLHLPNMRRVHREIAAKAEAEQWSYRDFLALHRRFAPYSNTEIHRDSGPIGDSVMRRSHAC